MVNIHLWGNNKPQSQIGGKLPKTSQWPSILIREKLARKLSRLNGYSNQRLTSNISIAAKYIDDSMNTCEIKYPSIVFTHMILEINYEEFMKVTPYKLNEF